VKTIIITICCCAALLGWSAQPHLKTDTITITTEA